MSDLKDFIIENGVLKKYVGNDAEVVIPDVVTQIAPKVFKNKTDIVTVILPNGIDTIGAGAFCGCTSLAKIDIPEGVVRIGGNAFEGCSALVSMFIPCGVTKIEKGLFKKCTSLVSVTLPEGVTAIGEHKFRYNFDGAFEYCESLKSVNLPESLKLIGANTFRFCTSLESVCIPKNVKTIGYDAFVACGAKTISYPFSDDSVCAKTTVFSGCEQVESIIANSKEGYNALWKMLEKDSHIKILRKEIEKGVTDSHIITKIKSNKAHLLERAINEDDEALASYVLSLHKSIALDELSEYIDRSSDAPKVTAVLLNYKTKLYSPEKTEQIESVKAEKELGLRERTVTDWKAMFNFEKSTNGIVITDYKDTLLDVVIPSKIGDDPVVAIGAWCFSARKNPYKKTSSKKLEVCKNIETVTLPETVTSIGYRAFYKCEKLKTIHHLDHSIHVNRGAFSGCDSMADENNFIIVNGVLYGYCGAENDITIPESVIEIDELAFSCQQKLTSVIIPDSVVNIGDGAFDGCRALASVKLPEKLQAISWKMFKCCRKLQSIDLPSSVTKISSYAFEGCGNLENIVIPNNVVSVGEYAFSECKNLKSVTIPNSETHIERNAFRYCENLTIHAPTGSYAEQYAKENNIPFVAE